MKGKIDKKGWLLIKRGSAEKHQYCMHGTEDEGCGDWCPCFGEPEPERHAGGKPYVNLCICRNRVLAFSELEDLRE